MNSVQNIQNILERAGLRVTGIDTNFIYIEDPSCILRGFETFLGYAWDVLLLITVFLIMGWGISMIRGAKNDILNNMKSLVLIFGILTVVPLILNLVYGGDLIGRGCKTLKVSVGEINEILAARAQTKSLDASLYEDIDIYDSGPNSGL
ncbi:MAG: hypothetical protein J5620_02090 [Alphaproteobacteria bacterium]|nr:hypothetical protein [Alphaproteobacteria bacterium]